jgi:uncharacterized protein (DUF2147 family)
MIPGVYDNTGRKAKQDSGPRKQAPQQAKNDPQAPATEPAQPQQAPVAQQAPAPAATTVQPPAATAAVTPVDPATTAPPVTSAPAPQVQQSPPPTAQPAPAPVVATAPATPTAAPKPAAPAALANSPLGVWLTEEKEGKVRIEQCGANLCGYSVDAKSNQNGEQVLINMKPGKDKWTGRIHDPSSGSTYDSTIALKGSDRLRVQGCAMGGMFCGGQTWSRLN